MQEHNKLLQIDNKKIALNMSENMNMYSYKINGLTEVQYTACMNLLNSKPEMWKQKMTRQHAHELVFGKCKTWEGKEVANFLDALEALGLLKFEEPLNTPRNIIKLNLGESPECIIEQLRKGGFKIVPIDNAT